MNKAILIAIKPQHLANILNGKKTIEVRKNKALVNATKKMIAEQGYAQFLAYCSKNEYLYRTNKGYIASNKPLRVGKGTEYTFAYSDEGKVVCSFKCYKVEEISCFSKEAYPYPYDTETISADELEKRSCLTNRELERYLGTIDCSIRNVGYAIHISDLKIFDKPKELKELYGCCDNYTKNVNIFKDINDNYIAQYFDNSKCLKCKHYDGDNWCLKIENPITKAPQNFVYVEIPND